jgi:transcriptional pleiotropic regulator of transition state genes
MKSTGITRKIDELGRIVLPIELRRTLDIGERDAMEIFVEEDRIILRKYKQACIFCGNDSDIKEFKGKYVCEACSLSVKQVG